jgi:hypothetical protein
VKRSLAVCGLGIFLCSLPQSAPLAQQQLAPEGTFTITYTGVNTSPVQAISIGKDQDMTVAVSTMTAVNDAGNGLLHQTAGRCLMSVVIDKAAKTLDQHGYCTYTDAEGHQLHERVDFDKAALGAVVVGKGQWIGGTGKFAGMQGEFEIRHSSIKSAVDGVIQGTGKKVGAYRRSST